MKPNHRESLANNYSIERLKEVLENHKPKTNLCGKNNGMFKDGNGEKYKRIWVDGKKVRLSHIVWRIHNNSKIPMFYNIHHKDEDKRNNHITNLELVKEIDHSKLNLGNLK